MKKALILHAWFGTPDDAWYPWVRSELEKKGYKVYVPELKDNEKPRLKDWAKCIMNTVGEDVDFDQFVVIGHSLGSAFALRLAEKYKMKKLILVSGWDYWDLEPEHETFFNPRIDHSKIKKNVKDITVIHSDNDPYVTEFIAREFAKRLGAEFILLKGKGHFMKDDGVEELPEVVKGVF